MPQQQVQSQVKMKGSSACQCCPYGFHIDRDFVRYCDSLYNSAQLEKLKQHKRERRKEKKSVESYLGLTHLVTVDIEKPVNGNVDEQPKLLSSDLFLNYDCLKDAVTDFEDTWQKSLKKSSSCHAINEKTNGLKTFENLKTNNSGTAVTSYLSHVNSSAEEYSSAISDFANAHSRSSSTSSISSRSTTVSSVGIQVPFIQDNADCASMSQQIAAAMSSLSHTGVNYSHNTMGIHRSVLTCIREQMATSLSRMKDLEEQVKSIPLLQVKLSALKEEKKALLLQLKSKEHVSNNVDEQFEKLENQDSINSRLQRINTISKNKGENLSSPAIASSLNAAIVKKCYIEKEIISHLKVDSNRTNDYNAHKENSFRNVKSIGVSCAVLTRDIGVGYIPNKYKSIGVGNDSLIASNVELCIQCKKNRILQQSTSMSSESLESDIDSLEDDNILNNLKTRYLKQRSSTGYPEFIHTSIPTSILVHVAVGTEIKCITKSVNTDLKHSDVVSKYELDNKRGLMKNKSTFCTLPFKLTKAIQTFDSRSFRHFGVQTVTLKSNSDVIRGNSVVKESLKSDVFIAEPISDANNFAVKVKSVAVGNSSIDIICNKCSSFKTVLKASGNDSEYESSCSKCILRQTETIGVGDNDINNVSCENCQTEKTSLLKEKCETQSIGTNTISDSLNNLNISDGSIHICDKCSATIHSVAQDLAANNIESKIPRLNRTSASAVKILKQTKHTKFDSQLLKLNKFTAEKSNIKDAHSNAKGSSSNQQNLTKAEEMLNDDQLRNPMSENLEDQLSCDKVVPEQNLTCESLDLHHMPALPHKKVELSKEVKAACKVLNDYLQKPERGSEKKIISSSRIIQNEWFQVANQKHADPLLIESYLDSFEEFSKPLLHRIVNLSDTNGNTALHYAVSYGNFDVVSILIDSKVCDVNKQNKAGYTSIMLVALADMKTDAHHYVVQRLFSIGDINIKAIQNGQTALMLAVSHGKKDIAKMLLDVGSEINLQDKDGSTALMCAAEHGHLDIVKLLLSHPECDPYVVDGDDCNALTIAMEAGHKDIGLLIYANMNFSRGSSPYSTLKSRKRSTPRSTPPPRTPTLRTPPPPSPSARSTNSIPSSFHFHN